MTMLLIPPPPPPPPEDKKEKHSSPSNTNNSFERRQKNKAMFANAFEQIRNVGKTSTNKSNTELSFSSSKISSSILEQSNNNQQKEHSDNLIIRDPRLLKHSNQQLIQNINKTTITTTTTINNNNNISSIFKEKEEEEIKKEEFNNNETLTIKIVNKEEENSSLLLKPYSPSQVIISSSELMELEEGNDEKTIYPTLKEKEDFQQIETKIIEENKKEKSEHLNENISGIDESGGEIPMDISASSADLSTTQTTSNKDKKAMDELSPESISSDSEKEKDEGEEEFETIFPQQLINTSSSSGFGFDYLTWNTSSSPLKIRSEQIPTNSVKTNNETNIIGYEHSSNSNGEGSKISNDDKIQIEDKNEEKKEEEDDKDFRQLWPSSEIRQKWFEKTSEVNITKSTN
ncbi:hypothetical protein Mgra_00003115 [Meloidogyne graminicola]|uniref:Uncharacterized protein n=1 Tax=Meloidogyne graminicola TaxID=189291 RepID=A0A8S9ZWR4_9BILA|nr:hypothetical protein Mgra_00003115 [Meloidogyne graminicola]